MYIVENSEKQSLQYLGSDLKVLLIVYLISNVVY